MSDPDSQKEPSGHLPVVSALHHTSMLPPSSHSPCQTQNFCVHSPNIILSQRLQLPRSTSTIARSAAEDDIALRDSACMIMRWLAPAEAL
jgi:hypothetical protein